MKYDTVALPSQKYGELIPNSTIDSIIRAIAIHFNPYKIFLFGSYATNSADINSDLDLLIVIDNDEPSYKRSNSMRLLFKPMPCAMDFLVFNPSEFEYWNGIQNHIITDVVKNGRLVYER